AAGKVISGNTKDGISIPDASSTRNQGQGNRIGTNGAGTAALPNGAYGGGGLGQLNQIGSPPAGTRNPISGNASGGIVLRGARNVVLGNTIGPDAAGKAGLSGTTVGVYLSAGATQNDVGTASSTRNVISGNLIGILVDPTATQNNVRGNYIGTNGA